MKQNVGKPYFYDKRLFILHSIQSAFYLTFETYPGTSSDNLIPPGIKQNIGLFMDYCNPTNIFIMKCKVFI